MKPNLYLPVPHSNVDVGASSPGCDDGRICVFDALQNNPFWRHNGSGIIKIHVSPDTPLVGWYWSRNSLVIGNGLKWPGRANNNGKNAQNTQTHTHNGTANWTMLVKRYRKHTIRMSEHSRTVSSSRSNEISIALQYESKLIFDLGRAWKKCQLLGGVL